MAIQETGAKMRIKMNNLLVNREEPLVLLLCYAADCIDFYTLCQNRVLHVPCGHCTACVCTMFGAAVLPALTASCTL